MKDSFESQINSLSGQTTQLCYHCHKCTAGCPTAFAMEYGPDRILRLIQFGQMERVLASRDPWLCLGCEMCGVHCPNEIDVGAVMIALRQVAAERGYWMEDCEQLRAVLAERLAEGRARLPRPYSPISLVGEVAVDDRLCVGIQRLNRLSQTITTLHNVSGDDNSGRLIWSQNLEVVPEGVRGKEQAEVVYFVGCTGSFYPMTYVIPQAFVHILEQVGVDFATMGPEEWCCGFPLIIAGMSEVTRDLIAHNVAAVRKLGAKTLVAACPSCLHTWEHTYPEVLGEPLGFEVKHTTEFLEELIAEGRIKLGSFDRPVTYHDPCDLGRTSGIYDAPRNVIRAVPGIEFREMADIREYALCCGGGGDVEMADRDLVAAVSKRRLEQAQATEAQVILSACQQCKRTLTAATRREKVRMRVLDLVELVDRVLEE